MSHPRQTRSAVVMAFVVMALLASVAGADRALGQEAPAGVGASEEALLVPAEAPPVAVEEAVEEAPEEAERIVVTATRTESKLSETPGSVTVIDTADLQRSTDADIGEALDSVEGMRVSEQGGPGSLSGVHIRGSFSPQTLVLVDGRSVNMPSVGQADASTISPEFLERVEVVRGPASALYGTGAVGGVVQAFTRRVPDEPLTEMKLATGSFNAASATFITGAPYAPYGTGGVVYGVTCYTTEGQRDNSEFDMAELMMKWAQGSDESGRLTITAGARRSHAGNPGPMPAAGTTPRFGNEEVTSLVDCGDSISGYLQAIYELGCLRIRASAAGRDDNVHSEYEYWNDYFGAFGDMADSYNDYRNKTSKPELEATVNWKLGEIVGLQAGSSYTYDRFDTTTVSVSTGQTTFETSGYTSGHIATRNTAAAWSQLDLRGERGSAILGVRWDEPNDFDGHPSARALGSLKLGEGLRLEAGIGNAFRAPSLNDMHWPYSGNPDLKPETSLEAEVGVKLRPALDGGVRVTAAAFSKAVSDMIRWSPDVTGTWAPENVDDVSVMGLELAASARLPGGVKLTFAYTYLEGEEDTSITTFVENGWDADPLNDIYTIEDTKRILANVPPHKLNMGLEWCKTFAFGGKLSAGLSIGWVSGMQRYYEEWVGVGIDAEVYQRVKDLDPYTLVGLRLGWSWAGGEAFLKVDNLLDEEYSEQLGTSLRDRAYPMPGRAVTVGARVSF